MLAAKIVSMDSHVSRASPLRHLISSSVLKGPSLDPDIFSEKVSHKNKHLCKILFSNDI